MKKTDFMKRRLGKVKKVVGISGLFFTAQALVSQGGFAEKSQETLATKQITSIVTKPAREAWSKKMTDLYKTLTDLLMDITSDQRFNAPELKGKIEREAKLLSSLAHDLETQKVKSPDQDPTIQILSRLFASESNRAYQELKRGNRTYARGILRSISGYCAQCHTRDQSGPAFARLGLQLSSAGATRLEQGLFYVATRQFDLAQAEFKSMIADPEVSGKRPFEWEKAVKQSLVIAVRVRQEPSEALGIVDQILSNKAAPYFLKQNAASWKKTILDWQKETPLKAPSEEQLYKEAMRLTDEAHRLQKYLLDRSADILYLRASAIVHTLLRVAPDGPHSGEAFLMAGLCYEVLRPLDISELGEIYYEACIHKTPHSHTAELCYQRYEESIYAGYTGTNGTQIPADVKDRLFTLESLAHPLTPEQN